MATAAPSPLASSVEKTNGAKVSRLVIDGGTTVLRKIFDGHHPPANLAAELNANKTILTNLLKKKILHKPQWNKLFPPGGIAPDSKTFDITLLFLLLTKICGLTPPPSGWHTKPPPSDTSREGNLARVKFYRNVLYGHVTTTGVDTLTFSALWTEISGVLVSLGLDQAEVDSLKAEKGGEQDYIDALIEWADSEKNIKSQLTNIHQSQRQTHQVVENVRQVHVKTQKTVEDIHQTQNKTLKTVEEIHQTQAKTQKTVEDIHQTQASTQKTMEVIHQTQAKTQKTVEDMHQTQNKTLKTVEDIHQTQAKTQKAMKDIHQTQASTQKTLEVIHQTQAKTQKRVEDMHHIHTQTHQSVKEVNQNVGEVVTGLEEIKEAMYSLKEGKDKDSSDEVLRNLTKSEFSGDIEYYVQRFQEGTREWVFDRVQNWLDDRSSQNRVMVISGNAGMGKSVIAAVICKRMQEAGRLSGSHFCQYNNVRYCKPQLMIQSLACHLSHALPEYKQALVKQLSRNLGTDLNNMGVEELFALLFKEPLSAVGDPGRNMLMVIDGLDESEYHGRNQLFDAISNHFCKLPTWIRFLVTTRSSTNITENLKHLKPFELKSDGEKNLEDIRVLFQKKLQHVIKPENVDDIVERLVLKSEGLMLCAHFLVLHITENTTLLGELDLDDVLPLGVSSVYPSYFRRLENELFKELGIKKEHFTNFVSAVAFSREPPPVSFVSKVLVPCTNAPLEKVLRVLGSVSTLFPVRDDCLHVIHKSVKDWLTDISCYGVHEFIVDEERGHRILADLCTDELDDLKRKGVHNRQFNANERYALYHGTHHMLHQGVSIEPHKLDELTKAYIIDLEIVYAKTCVNSTVAAEDLMWLKNQGICTLLSRDKESIVDTLLFLSRKFLCRFTATPQMFLQTILNEGGKLLNVEASNLLRNKYSEVSYMEIVHKETQQRGVVARFECSARVICLDVSPQLDYMVCECDNGMLQLWSLHTGKLVWTQPVLVPKNYHLFFPKSLFRPIAFHPAKNLVLPGILRQAYTMDGELKPLFPRSNCRFSACSISGDKTKILTNCIVNSKCLVLWSLENGSEIDRIRRNIDISSFAWSGDGRHVAVSHISGLICLLDVMHGFRSLAQLPTQEVCGMLKFSPDGQFLFCRNKLRFFSVSVNNNNHKTFSLTVAHDRSYDFESFNSVNDCGFLFGDLIDPYLTHNNLMFVLDKHRVLRCSGNQIEMVDTKKIDKLCQTTAPCATAIALSLDGQTVYVASPLSVSAYETFSGKLKAKIGFVVRGPNFLCAMKEGVLISSGDTMVELLEHDLSKITKRWLAMARTKQVVPISEERVAIVRECTRIVHVRSKEGSKVLDIVGGKFLLDPSASLCQEEVVILDISSGGIISTIPLLQGRVLTCNSKGQLVTVNDTLTSFQLLDGTTVVWTKNLATVSMVGGAVFSPKEQFLVVSGNRDSLLLDANTGNTLVTLSSVSFEFCKFVSDEKFVISRGPAVYLLNRFGILLSTTNSEGDVSCFTACRFNCSFAIGLHNSAPNFKFVKVHLPSGEDSENNER